MEKLQSALEKARSQRDQTAASAPALERTPPKQKSARLSELWAALTPVELNSRKLIKQRIVTDSARPEASHFDILRTKVVLQMKRKGWTRIAVTSPTPLCGKTTTACNLALGLGRQKDISAMLFDLDLRRPSISRVLDVSPDYDLPDLLNNDVGFEKQARRYGDNLALSLTRTRVADPTRLMLEQHLLDTFDDIEKTYAPDVMIFDLPPLLIGDDARAFIKNVDCVLIVARAEESTVQEIDNCEKEAAELTNVMGVVLNQSRAGSIVQDFGNYY